MQDWDTLERLFSEALELPCEQRPQFVRERSGENLWLRHELETLLEAPETSIEAAFDPSSGIVRQLLAALDTEYAVGREIGGYRIESLISSGGMGIVYRSSHIGTGEPAALKLLPPEDARNSDRMRRLAREAAALQMLYHPGIVRIREFRADAGAHFLAMELVEGETLRAVLGRGPIGLRQALDWARQIAAAVEAAHAAGVIHRDLKPSNVMIESPDSRVKLLDFGLARVPDAQSPHTQTTTGGAVAGTFAYFSPEQAKGGRGDERSDIFSFGAILYEMIAGRPAFDRPTGVATAAAVLSESPAPLPVQTPRAVRALLARCLAKDPARRFAGMGEIGEELERLLALEQRGRLRPGPRRPFLWAAACMLVVICASAALWWARHKAAAAPPSVAVLPFTNANGDPANQYLVDGLTEELTAGLSTAKGITVAVPSAAAPYNKGPRNLPDIGRRLHVSYLVEASMERTGDHLTVVASLERASGERVWTNTYQRRSVDLNAIESDLAEGIRGSLGLAKPISGPFTPSDKAHDLYLKARFEDDGVTLASNDKARADYRQVLELEPRYAAAYAGLAATFWNRNILAGQNASREDLRQAEAYWRKALELDPGYAAAHSGLALYVMQYDWDWNHAERELKAAIAQGPNMSAENTYAWLCLILGRRAEADQHLRRARDLDQQSWVTTGNSASIYRLEGRYAEARAEAEKIELRNPNAWGPKALIALTYAKEKRFGEAIQTLQPFSKKPSFAVPMAWCQALAGNREEALRLLRPLEEKYEETHLQIYSFALAHAMMGDEANTLKWLERSMDAHEFGTMYIRVDPLLAQFQDTPEFHALKKRMNLDW